MNLRLLFSFLVFVLLTNFVCVGQNKVTKNYTVTKNIRVGEEFYRFQVEEYSEREKRFYAKNKFYFWYKSQEIKRTQGGSGGLLLNGIYEHFYANKQLAEKGHFKKGLKHGTWTYWNENGYLTRIEQWRRGKPRGRTLIYDGKGNKIEHINIKFNRITYAKDSLFVIASKDSSKVQTYQLVFEDKISVFNYRHGKLHGKQLIYEDSLQEAPIIHRYKKGKLHGKQKEADGTVTKYKHGQFIEPKVKDTTERKSLFKRKERAEEDDSGLESSEKKVKKKSESNEEEKKPKKEKTGFFKKNKSTNEEE
jgi:antitoxin component YwqK of YwqJK toxin-antitoxin module